MCNRQPTLAACAAAQSSACRLGADPSTPAITTASWPMTESPPSCGYLLTHCALSGGHAWATLAERADGETSEQARRRPRHRSARLRDPLGQPADQGLPAPAHGLR